MPERSLQSCALLLFWLTATIAADAQDLPRKNKPPKLARVPWTTSRIRGTPEPPPPYRVERVLPQLTFDHPVVLTTAPGTERLFLAELNGRIYSLDPDDDGPASLFADLRQAVDGLRRVYGLTFHPRFAENRLVYVTYVQEENLEDGTHVSRFLATDDAVPKLRLDTEQILLRWRSGGHNGGCLKFGPDGYLYVSTGDGGPAFPPDPLASGQDVGTLLSAILRIDVDRADGDRPYAVPADNPFVDLDGARPEIWAYGFRNPWKMSFDRDTGDLWVGDVGWELWELVYRVAKGGNYGWSIFEGPQPVHRERPRGPTPVLPPTAAHDHSESRSVTGGLVYRGQRLPELRGAYVYGDYVTGKLWSAKLNENGEAQVRHLADSPLQIICFGETTAGDLLIVDYGGGLYRLEADERTVQHEFPRRLSKTGLFRSTEMLEPQPGVWEYTINAEPWSDGSVARRWAAIPGRESLQLHAEQNPQQGRLKGQWSYPDGSVLVKTIMLEGRPGDASTRRRLETQILHMERGRWRPYSYVWNDQQTDAELHLGQPFEREFTWSDEGDGESPPPRTWRFASRTQCTICHVARSGTVLGFEPRQLNRPGLYFGAELNQLDALEGTGIAAETPGDREPLPDPHDASEALDRRARAYLHLNCAHCHRRGSGGTAAMEVPYERQLAKTNLLDARPTQGAFGLHRARVLAPGDPYRSVLVYRVAKLGRGRMPYFGSSQLDVDGLQLLARWIEQMEPADAARARELEAERAGLRSRLEQVQRLTDAEQVHEWLADTRTALYVALHVDVGGEPLPAWIEAAARHPDPVVRDLFQRFLPEDQRRRTLGDHVDGELLLALEGDAERGAEVFNRLDCRKCHRVGQHGKEIGPELTKIGARLSRRELLQSIVDPSRRIEPKFATHLIETVDGRVFTGLKIGEDEQRLVLRDAADRRIEIAKSEVELSAVAQQSLMPQLLLRDATAQEAADLLSYLESLRGR